VLDISPRFVIPEEGCHQYAVVPMANHGKHCNTKCITTPAPVRWRIRNRRLN
jgi:hypothetical protein